MRQRRRQSPALCRVGRKGGYEVWQIQYRDSEGRARTKVLGRCSELKESKAIIARDRWLAPLNAGLEEGQLPEKFCDYVREIYMPDKALYRWKRSTAGTTEQLIRTHLLPAFEGRLLRTISRHELQVHLARKAQVLAEEGVKRLRSQIQCIFAMALGDLLIEHNPAPPKALCIPRDCRPGLEKRKLTLDQARQASRALSLRENLIFRLGTFAGMRPGETLALRLGDVDLAGNRLVVRQRVYRGKLDTPKSKRGLREIPLVLGTAKVLREWIGLLADRRPEAWLFPSEKPSSPLGRDNHWRRHLQPQLARLGLDWAGLSGDAALVLVAAADSRRTRGCGRCDSRPLGPVDENVYNQVSLERKQQALAHFKEPDMVQ